MRLRRGAVVVVLLSLGLSTATRVYVWGDGSRLWAEAVRHSPEKPRPWINRAREYQMRGNDVAAWRDLRHALTLSQIPRRDRLEGPMRPADAARLGMALIWANRGDYREALRISAQIRPRNPGSFVNAVEARWASILEFGTGPDF